MDYLDIFRNKSDIPPEAYLKPRDPTYDHIHAVPHADTPGRPKEAMDPRLFVGWLGDDIVQVSDNIRTIMHLQQKDTTEYS